MYTDILHRLKTIKSTQIYANYPGFDQAKEENNKKKATEDLVYS